MPKEEWGVKRACPQCGSRFYDLNNDPMTCPECGHGFTRDSLSVGRGRIAMPEKVSAARASTLHVDDLADDEVIDDDSNDVDIDDDLLEDDEDDTVPLDEIADVSGNDDDN